MQGIGRSLLNKFTQLYLALIASVQATA